MRSSKTLLVLLCLCLVVQRCGSRRGGVGMGRVGGGSRSRLGMGSRGSSGARSGGLFGRGSSGSRSGGLFGGGSRSGSRPAPIGTGGSGWNRGSRIGGSGGGWGSNAGGGGWNNRNKGGGGFGSSGWGSRPRTSSYSKSGIGSFVRSNKFKNAIVGAAAGYLTYQAGRALIRSAVAPMMWNNRQYYWGSNYYPSSYSRANMCRMPIDQSDQQFGNVYFQDGNRPREIVWSCGYNEHCCGYECCPSRGGWGWGYGGASPFWRIGVGSFLLTALLLCCGVALCCKLCTRMGTGQSFLRPRY